MVWDLSYHTILQKSTVVLGSGPVMSLKVTYLFARITLSGYKLTSFFVALNIVAWVQLM